MIDALTKALESHQEFDWLDFKRSFDVSLAGEWCEIIKDIIAMANSGGGIIIIGLENDGRPSNIDVSPVLSFDPANVTNKIYKYTDVQFCDFEVLPVEKDGAKLAAIIIKGASIPIIFTSPGTYAIDEKKQKTSFGLGTIYFRHGAKSEPGTINDLRNFLERELAVIRESWLSGIRKVVEAPPGSHIAILAC
jgi:predicted HTH transcriptional regulator